MCSLCVWQTFWVCSSFLEAIHTRVVNGLRTVAARLLKRRGSVYKLTQVIQFCFFYLRRRSRNFQKQIDVRIVLGMAVCLRCFATATARDNTTRDFPGANPYVYVRFCLENEHLTYFSMYRNTWSGGDARGKGKRICPSLGGVMVPVCRQHRAFAAATVAVA